MAVLADIDTTAVAELRAQGGDATYSAQKLQVVEEIRAKFRAVAADQGLDDPFERK